MTRRTFALAIALALSFIAAACTSSSSGPDTAEPERGAETTSTEGATPPTSIADDAQSDGGDIEQLQQLVSRTMPLDGNRLYVGPADLSVDPRVNDAFETGRIVLWETESGIDWIGLDESQESGTWFDGAGTVSLRAMPPPSLPDAIPDSLSVGDGTISVALTGPTDRYPHRALGDEIEASSIAIDVPVGGVRARIDIVLDDRDVVEGISPMLADLDGDGESEIIVTVSNAEGGARIVAYAQNGAFVAESAPIGTSNRWRHQIAVGPTGPNGETEIVVVRTPHIGGIVEWFRLEGDRLELAGTFEPRNGGINTTSHRLGSTNLDLAAVFDADGDGELELVIPTQDRSSLAVIGRTDEGGELEQLVDVPGNVVTNLAVLPLPDGTLAVGVGTDENQIVIWGG